MEKNTKNLKPFQPGQDVRRNLNGAPKKSPDLDELLATALSNEQGGITEAQAIILALIVRAKRGDVKAAELLLNRAYGKVADKLNIQGNVGITNRPIIFK